RYFHVTGVQTCALPISLKGENPLPNGGEDDNSVPMVQSSEAVGSSDMNNGTHSPLPSLEQPHHEKSITKTQANVVEHLLSGLAQIGRASCREKWLISVC